MAGREGSAELDHAVIMVRDRLQDLAPHFERQGYTLSPTATHNLGSWNRLIVLQHAYIELLGWPPGKPARQEIAASPLGLEALVLRTADARSTYERLREAGYAVNPVQVLTRPACLDGRAVEARFHTVRFAEQPIPGIRLYFCQHLTPEYVWQPALMRHANGAQSVATVAAHATQPEQVAQRLADLAATVARRDDRGWHVALGATRLDIAPAAQSGATGLDGLTLLEGTEGCLSFDTDIVTRANNA